MIDYICASPRKEKSCCYMLLQELQKRTGEVRPIGMWDEDMGVSSADTLVLAFPLYVDGLPASLLLALQALPQNSYQNVYALCNCGFYEGRQTAIAFELLENFCGATGRIFCGGVGIGGGGLIPSLSFLPYVVHPQRKAYRALQTLAERIKTSLPMDICYLSPTLPRWLYMAAAESSFKQPAKRRSLAALSKKNRVSRRRS